MAFRHKVLSIIFGCEDWYKYDKEYDKPGPSRFKLSDDWHKHLFAKDKKKRKASSSNDTVVDSSPQKRSASDRSMEQHNEPSLEIKRHKSEDESEFLCSLSTPSHLDGYIEMPPESDNPLPYQPGHPNCLTPPLLLSPMDSDDHVWSVHRGDSESEIDLSEHSFIVLPSARHFSKKNAPVNRTCNTQDLNNKALGFWDDNFVSDANRDLFS